jgi:hypothetical protein
VPAYTLARVQSSRPVAIALGRRRHRLSIPGIQTADAVERAQHPLGEIASPIRPQFPMQAAYRSGGSPKLADRVDRAGVAACLPSVVSTSHNQDGHVDREHKLVWHPDCGPDLAEFTRDLARGRAGILTDVHLTEQAKRHNAVGVSGMCGKASHSGIGLGGEWQDLPSLPEVCGAEHVPLFSPVVVLPHPANNTPGSALTTMPRA